MIYSRAARSRSSKMSYVTHLQQQMCLTLEVLSIGQGLVVICRSSRCKGSIIDAATKQLCHVYAPPALWCMQSSRAPCDMCIMMAIADKNRAHRAQVQPRCCNEDAIPEVTAAGRYQALKVLQGGGSGTSHPVQDHQLFQHLQPQVSSIPETLVFSDR